MAEEYYELPRLWVSKDTLPREIQFLQPLNASGAQAARIMVGPRQAVVAADSASQTLAISAATSLQWSANTLVPGSWNPPQAGVGVLWEMLRGALIETDAAGKIQVVPALLLVAGNNNVVELAPTTGPLPINLPAYANAAVYWHAKIPTPPYLPTDGPIPNGPLAQCGLINTDGAATHSYKRVIAYFYRYIFDVDYTKERVYVLGTLT